MQSANMQESIYELFNDFFHQKIPIMFDDEQSLFNSECIVKDER